MSEMDELKRKLELAMNKYQAEQIKQAMVEEKYEEKGMRCVPCERKQAEIDRLTKEVERLEEENDLLRCHHSDAEKAFSQFGELQAKVARYEEALDDICRQGLSDEIWTRDEQEYIDSDWQGAYDEIIRVARAARQGQG